MDTLITAELPEVNEIQSISGIKSAHSPLQSHSKEASAQKRWSKNYDWNHVSSRVWDILHSPVCSSCICKDGPAAGEKQGKNAEHPRPGGCCTFPAPSLLINLMSPRWQIQQIPLGRKASPAAALGLGAAGWTWSGGFLSLSLQSALCCTPAIMELIAGRCLL